MTKPLNFSLNFELRRTTERVTELRDLFDELDDIIQKVKRHQAHMGVPSDEKTKKMLRTSIKNVVRKRDPRAWGRCPAPDCPSTTPFFRKTGFRKWLQVSNSRKP